MGFEIMGLWFSGKIHLDKKIMKKIIAFNKPIFHHSTISLFHPHGKFGSLERYDISPTKKGIEILGHLLSLNLRKGQAPTTIMRQCFQDLFFT